MSVDLNSDLGEGFGRWTLGDDDALLDVVTSANVACGFHAGDPDIMRAGLRAGRASAAWRSAPRWATATCAGFGRRFIDVDPADADRRRDLPDRRAGRRSPGSPATGCATSSRTARSTTPIVHHEEQAAAVVDGGRRRTTRRCRCSACPARRCSRRADEAGLTTVAEAFADRAYTAAGHAGLPPAARRGAARPGRRSPRALRRDGHRASRSADGDGVEVPSAESICVHGDTPGAVEMARRGARGARRRRRRRWPRSPARMTRLLPLRRRRAAAASSWTTWPSVLALYAALAAALAGRRRSTIVPAARTVLRRCCDPAPHHGVARGAAATVRSTRRAARRAGRAPRWSRSPVHYDGAGPRRGRRADSG